MISIAWAADGRILLVKFSTKSSVSVKLVWSGLFLQRFTRTVCSQYQVYSFHRFNPSFRFITALQVFNGKCASSVGSGFHKFIIIIFPTFGLTISDPAAYSSRTFASCIIWAQISDTQLTAACLFYLDGWSCFWALRSLEWPTYFVLPNPVKRKFLAHSDEIFNWGRTSPREPSFFTCLTVWASTPPVLSL
jgi:hypothetical protein